MNKNDIRLFLYINIMNKISRKIFADNINDTDAVKALALLIYVKNVNGASVISNFSYNKLAKITKLSRGSIKKRLNTLGNMDLLDFVGRNNNNLLFKRVRAPKSNIDISKIDTTSIKSIELGLRALVIVEIQRQKNYVKQQVVRGTSPKNGRMTKHEYRSFKRANKFCKKRGIKEFTDNGVSYNTLSKRMGVGLNKTSEAIKYGVEKGLFVKNNNIKLYEKTNGFAQIIIETSKSNNLFTTHRNNNVYIYKCNTYSIIGF